MRKKVFIHIGFHKTATTFLQQNVYPKLKQEIKYIRKKRIDQELYDLRLKRLSDENIYTIRTNIEAFMHPDKPVLISYEGLSGSPFSQKKSKNNLKVLEDLRRTFPADTYDTHIIVGVRDQIDLLTSLYVQYLHQGGYKSAKALFKDWEDHGILDHYHYYRYLQKIEELFGPDNYYLLQYENFRNDEYGQILQLLQYMGIDRVPKYNRSKLNRSYGVMQAVIARKLNYFVKTPLNPNGKIPIVDIPKIGIVSPRRLLQNNASFALHYKRYSLPVNLQKVLQLKYQKDNEKLAEAYHIKDYSKS
ncbi:sulfotransferase [Marinococcus luteus]|uniref:sulfotransferase n=1 Tax=Marinococcus luteus TaxID=1122204 RepID=UPI002ACCB114|nr:sulfotransferase [Marinococcus luteus]MDZ5782462.1 sulfotransferase [Marinococcus luteus]